MPIDYLKKAAKTPEEAAKDAKAAPAAKGGAKK